LNLNGETVDEGIRYKQQHRAWDELIPIAGAELHGWTRSGQDALDRCTPSLKLGIVELRRLTA
jgi:hypothetical protein